MTGMLPPQTHAGQRALVTAAATGIGRVTAQALLDAGARVFICDSNQALLSAALMEEPRLQGLACDVTAEDQVMALFAAAVKEFGGLDILVNNAGIAGPTALVEETPLADWRQCLAVNLDASFLCARETAPLMRRQGSGSIVNMSSTAGLFGLPRRAPYASAKWAIRGLTRTLAQELGPHGVRVNCIAPGLIKTDFAKALWENPDTLKAVTRHTPMRRIGEPHEIAGAAVFLASPASTFMTGQAIVVDGGSTVGVGL